jgi:predicted kinase
MAALHFIYGKPGAGKTRLARELGASLPAVVFCEDEYVAATGEPIVRLEQFVERSRRLRELLVAPMAIQVLRLGVSVVFDFAGNTVAHRAWARSVFEAAGADHLLHVLDVSDDECKRRVRERNLTRPPGLYFGDVSEEIVNLVLPHITPPAACEGFQLIRH